MGFSPNGGNISGANDVALNNPVNNHVLTYDSTLAKWKNSSAPSSLAPVIKTAAQWKASADVLTSGQIGLASDTGESRYGNGVDTWSSLPSPLATHDGKVRVENFGTLGTANDTSVFQAACNAASVHGSQLVVKPGQYYIEGLTIPDGVILGPDSGAMSRFGLVVGVTGSTRRSTVNLRRINPGVATSTAPLVTVTGDGAGLRNVQLEGNGAPGTILEMGGFETVLDSVRCISGSGIGLDVQRGNNTRWHDVYVDNCGGAAIDKPAVKIWSKTGAGLAAETNTLDIRGFTIERSRNVALEIAVGPTNDEAYAEWVRIFDLHLESSYLDYQNTDPLIRIGNVRAVSFVDAMIYGGGGGANGVILRHEESVAKSYGSGGIRFIGGTILGPDTAAGAVAMPVAVDLVTGNDVAFIGTRFLRYDTNAIRVAPTYGGSVFVDPSTWQSSKLTGKTFMDDARTTKTTLPFFGNVEIEGHLQSTQLLGKPTIADQNGATGGSILNNSTDTEGVVFWGTGASPTVGLQQIISFKKSYARQPAVTITPANAATAALGLYVSSNTNDFRIYCINAPAFNLAASSFQVHYHVIG